MSTMKGEENTRHLKLAFYGDDFTGSTDALEFLTMAGARVMLFMKPPPAAMLARYPELDAIGIAGTTRSMTPEEIAKTLKPAFAALDRLAVPHIHYKVCSTFDSSPERGSIGKAIDIGAAIFSPVIVPLLVAAPALGRYCLFGNLFARMGTGETGPVYRLDRHPSMSRHPVTPASESDLLVHLSRQTAKKSGLLDILQLNEGLGQATAVMEDLRRGGAEVILIDALDRAQLNTIGAIIDRYAAYPDNTAAASAPVPSGKVFSVGSSGVEMALGALWAGQGRLKAPPAWQQPGPAAPMLVISGSCSPVTRDQVERALQHGFQPLELNPASDPLYAVEARALPEAAGKYAQYIRSVLKAGKSVILHTGSELGSRNEDPVNSPIGKVLGHIAKAVLESCPVKRLVVAGGDTSGEVAGELGIEALEMIAPLTPGAPLCRAHAPGLAADGLEVCFKGGQVGTPGFFVKALEGTFRDNTLMKKDKK